MTNSLPNCQCPCHQPQRDEVKCNCGMANDSHLWDCAVSTKDRSGKVEKKIQEIVGQCWDADTEREKNMTHELRELVRLAREGK